MAAVPHPCPAPWFIPYEESVGVLFLLELQGESKLGHSDLPQSGKIGLKTGMSLAKKWNRHSVKSVPKAGCNAHFSYEKQEFKNQEKSDFLQSKANFKINLSQIQT